MKVESKPHGEKISIIKIYGAIDTQSSVLLKKEAYRQIQSGRPHVAVDLGDVGYMDSAGLGILLQILKTAKQSKGTFCLFGVREEIMKILSITEFDKIIDIYDTEKKTIQELGKR